MIDPHISSHKVDWLLMGICSMTATISTQSHLQGVLDAESLKQVLCACFGGIGSVASGYLGSVLFPVKGMSFRQCWITNFICGFMLAPIATYLVIAHYPSLPIPITASATSFILGAVGVKTLQYIWPLVLKFYARSIGQSSKNDKADATKDE